MFLHFSAKKVECANHQWIHLVGDQRESPQAFENHLAEVVRSKPGRRICGENATYPPIWAYSRTLPQGVQLLV